MRQPTVHELETRFRSLDMEIKRLERRGMHMTPPEQMRATQLKKHRLVTMDMLSDLMKRAS
jgi:uncharacterized protein YdcH (DUF465 family)